MIGIDEEMGAIRLIAAEEELVVSIFEWLKLNEAHFPEHKQFVRKFKNHIVKLAFYPSLVQFRFVMEDMLEHGVAPEANALTLDFTCRLIANKDHVRIGLFDSNDKEIINVSPLNLDISNGEKQGKEVCDILLEDLKNRIASNTGMKFKEFILNRADYRNKLLYASDGGSVIMDETLPELTEIFKKTYHDLLWTIAFLLDSHPPSKEWGIVSQFIGMYNMALIETGVLSPDPVSA